jgi:DNA-binding transcriptional ArsR family regulator
MAGPSPLQIVALTAAPEEEQPVLDLVFAALSDPVRRAILDRLDGQDLLVSEVAAYFDISLQAISRHLQVLVRAGLVTQERSGRISRCRLDAGPIYAASVWLNRYSRYWQAQFDLLAASLEAIERERLAGPRRARRGKGDRATPARGKRQAARPPQEDKA